MARRGGSRARGESSSQRTGRYRRTDPEARLQAANDRRSSVALIIMHATTSSRPAARSRLREAIRRRNLDVPAAPLPRINGEASLTARRTVSAPPRLTGTTSTTAVLGSM